MLLFYVPLKYNGYRPSVVWQAVTAFSHGSFLILKLHLGIINVFFLTLHPVQYVQNSQQQRHGYNQRHHKASAHKPHQYMAHEAAYQYG